MSIDNRLSHHLSPEHIPQKEEMGEILHEVDFNQLKIENQQYVEKIDERNQDLLRLKLMAGNTLQILNAYKKKLATLTSESEHLRTDIGSRHELLRRIAAETEVQPHTAYLSRSTQVSCCNTC